MIDVKKYNITQQELDEYISTIVIPNYSIEIRPIDDYYELYIKLEDGTEVNQGYYAYNNIDTTDTGKLFEEKFIDELCEEHFKDKLIIPIDLKANATKEDINHMQQRMTELELLILGV